MRPADCCQEFAGDERFLPLLHGLLVLRVPVAVQISTASLWSQPKSQSQAWQQAKGLVDGDEARVVGGLVAPFDVLLTVQADGLPVARAGGDLDGTANEEEVGDNPSLGSASSPVAEVYAVVTEKDEIQLLGEGILHLLGWGVLTVRVTRVRVEVTTLSANGN